MSRAKSGELTPTGKPNLYDLSSEGRKRLRQAQADERKRPDRRTKDLVIVNTGNGKGKTTAALGMLTRAWGRDMRVVMLQFLKSKTANFGETSRRPQVGRRDYSAGRRLHLE